MRLRGAFTLIELLVVVAVIVLLISITLAVMPMLREQARRQATLEILQVVDRTLSVVRAQRGGSPASVPHPFAGSRAERFRFVRADGTTDVPTGGPAVLRAPPGWTGSGTLLRPDDLFADSRCPQFYGMRRDRLTILGVELATVVTGDTVAADGTRQTVTGSGTGDDAKQALTYFLSAGAGLDELVRLQAYRATPDDTNLILDGRAWSDGTPMLWKGLPGAALNEAGSPRPYLLRGAGIYDAWGREVLANYLPSGALRLSSAGRDGVFRFDIVRYGLPAAVPLDGAALPGRDGAMDNIETVPERTP